MQSIDYSGKTRNFLQYQSDWFFPLLGDTGFILQDYQGLYAQHVKT